MAARAPIGASFLSCIQNEFSRWNVNVTDQDPGSIPHIEAMVGGRPQDAGFGQGVGGVSPMMQDCSLVETSIVYVFSDVLGTPQTACEVAAQELGHSIGMDHEYLCSDPMTYLSGCGHKTFQDQTVSCGESAPRACSCSQTQNSVQFMNARLGVAGGPPPPPPPPPPPTNDNTPPTIVLGAPADGSTMPANTQLTVTANISDPDDAVASAVMVWEYNGQVLNFDCANPPNGFTCTHNGASYRWTLSVGSGPRAWTIKATDSHGNVATSARRTLTLGSGQPPPPPPPPPNGPTVQFDASTAGATYSPGRSIPIQVTAADPSSSIASAQLRWRSPSGDALFDLSQVSTTDWAATLQLSAAAVSGTRSLLVTVTDGNGVKASTSALVIRVQ